MLIVTYGVEIFSLAALDDFLIDSTLDFVEFDRIVTCIRCRVSSIVRGCTGVLEQLIDHAVGFVWEFGDQCRLPHGLHILGLIGYEDAEDCDDGVLGYRNWVV